MNKRKKKILVRTSIVAGALTAGLVPTLAVVACGTSTPSRTVNYANAPTFEYKGTLMTGKKLYTILSDPDNPRWVQAKADIEKAGAEAKFTGIVQINKTQEQQNAALGAQLTSDAYILGASDSTGFGSQIATLATSKPNAPIIAYDRLLETESANYNWYVTFDSTAVGRLQGLSIINSIYGTTFTEVSTTDADIIAAVTKAVADGKRTTQANVLAMAGGTTDNNAKLFFNGAKAVLDLVTAARDPKFKLASTWDLESLRVKDWDYSVAQSNLVNRINALSAADKTAVKAVLAPNDGMANSAINALNQTALNPNSIWITGLDANPEAVIRIKDGNGQDMTVFKPDYSLGRVAVALAAILVNDKSKTPSVTTSPSTVKDAIVAAYPALPASDISVDTTNFKTSDKANAKIINTVLLAPKLITSANLSQYFTVS